MTRDTKPLNPFAAIPSYKRIPKKRAKARKGPWRSREYRQWISEHPSILSSGARPGLRMMLPVSDPCHTVNNGMSSKGPDSSCIPLTREEHLAFDADREGFQRMHGFDATALAAQYWAEYQREQA